MDATLIQKLQNSPALPSLPSIAIDVLRLAEDPSASMGKIAESVQKDVAFTAQLLKTANSAFYGQRREVNSVEFALQLIGLKAAIPLIISISMNSLRQSCDSTIDLQMYWRRSVLTSCLSTKLAEFSDTARKEEALLAGLVQDIGVLAGTVLFPEEYGNLPASTWENHHELLPFEKELYNDNHISIGNWLLESWDFPPIVIDAVKHSHKTPDQLDRDLAWCVSGSSLMADCILRGLESGNLWNEVKSCLRLEWLNVPEEKITALTIEMMELVLEAESIFDIEILPKDILNVIEQKKAELVAS